MYLFFNNDLIKEKEFKISADNRSFNYGDGLFETIVVRNSQINYLDDHFERLAAGANALSIALPAYFDSSYLEKSIKLLLKARGVYEARIKLHVWRKPGGLFFPQDNGVDFLITASALKSAKDIKEKAGFFDSVPKAFSAISKYKTCNVLPYIMAATEGQKQGLDDMILLDANGNVSECTSSNIFWEKQSVLYTPSLQSACIDGVLRKQILSFCKQEGIAYDEGLYDRESVEQAELVFTSNVAGISCIKQIENKTYYTTSSIAERIKARFS